MFDIHRIVWVEEEEEEEEPKWAIDAKTLAPKYWPSEQGKGQFAFHTCFLILFAPTKCRKDASPILQNSRMSEAAAFDFVPVVRNDKRQVISVHFKLIGELRHAQKLFKYAVHVKKFYHFTIKFHDRGVRLTLDS